MKLRNKMMISMFISIGLLIILSFILYSTYQEITKTIEKGNLAKEIVTNVIELSVIRTDYLLYPEERAKTQWFLVYDSLGKNIKKAEKEKEWVHILKDIGQKYDELKSVFSELVNYKEGANEPKELEAGLVEKVLIKSQEIIFIANSLHDLAHAQIQSAFKQMIILIIGFIVASIIIIINSFIILNSILKPIAQLHKATEELEKRNFDVKVDIKTNDELEQLGKAFNKTAEALGKVEEELKQIDKTKTEFLSITSHELRSPMTPMKAQLQMLLEDYFGKLNDKQKESLDIVLRNTNRLDNLIKDLLEISRIGAGRLRFNFMKTSLNSYIDTTINEMKGFMPEKKIKLEQKTEKLPVIEVDPDRVMQILRNLLNNAIKFSKDNGKIEISAQKKGNFILFSIKDYGEGIADNKKERIFEPFFQGEGMYQRKFGGTGLGLTICKGIVESQKGKIWFESKKGIGTTFYFTIPLVPVREIKTIKLIRREERVKGRETLATGREERVKGREGIKNKKKVRER